MYDIIIIGAGVNGAFCARTLAKYKLNILVIDKNSDVGNGTSMANSAIIHSGYDPHPGTLKSKVNVMGNKMYDRICSDLDIEFKRIGSMTIATTDEECQMLEELEKNAKLNGVDVKILEGEEIFKEEPFATRKAKKALLAPTAGIINPFELCVGLMENAMENGVNLHLSEEVMMISKEDDLFNVITNKGEYSTKAVINAAGIYADKFNNMIAFEKVEITPRKGEYYVLDHFPQEYVTHTLFSLPSKYGKGVLVTPTTHKNYLIGPSATFIDDKDDVSTNKEILDSVLNDAYRVVDNIPMNYLIREFAGLRAYHESDDFIINEPVKGFYNMVGMASPGLASAPASAMLVVTMISHYLELIPKNDFKEKRRPLYRLNTKTDDEREALIKENPSFGNIVCRCEQISEGEVVDAIHRLCGATTVKGIKKRVRPGFGKCQGGFCEPNIVKILARELGINEMDVKYDSDASYIFVEETKEGKNE